MFIPKTPTHLSAINENHTFCAYDGGGSENILFLGSCRLSPLMFYYSQINPKINIYNIYTPYWTEEQRQNFPIDNIKKILPRTPKIITESLHHCGILNTNGNNGFFETFDAKHLEEFRIPNLHLAIYLYDIVWTLKENKENYIKVFNRSLIRLCRSCDNKGYGDIADFIIEYLSDIRLFYTFNHPAKILSMLTFKLLMQKLGESQSIPDNFYKDMIAYNFLEGHCAPILPYDIDKYKFRFDTRIFDNSILDTPGAIYKPDKDEFNIPDKFLNLI